MGTQSKRPTVSSYPPPSGGQHGQRAKIETTKPEQQPAAEEVPPDAPPEFEDDDAVVVEEMPAREGNPGATANLALSVFFRSVYRDTMTKVAGTLATSLGLQSTDAHVILAEVSEMFK